MPGPAHLPVPSFRLIEYLFLGNIFKGHIEIRDIGVLKFEPFFPHRIRPIPNG